jgi:hypothetical protein
MLFIVHMLERAFVPTTILDTNGISWETNQRMKLLSSATQTQEAWRYHVRFACLICSPHL